MPLTTIAILQEIGDLEYAPFFNKECPIWVEGSYTSKDFSILTIDVDVSKVLDAIEQSIVDNNIYMPEEVNVKFSNSLGFLGTTYRLSLFDLESIITWSSNTLLAPWQEARLPSHPGDDDANAAKAILVWTSYWVSYAVNLGVKPLLKIGQQHSG